VQWSFSHVGELALRDLPLLERRSCERRQTVANVGANSGREDILALKNSLDRVRMDTRLSSGQGRVLRKLETGDFEEVR